MRISILGLEDFYQWVFYLFSTCIMCNYTNDNAPYAYTKNFKNIWNYFELLENRFYNNHNENSRNEVFMYNETRLKKASSKNLLSNTITKDFNFNKYITNIYWNASRKLNALLTVPFLINYQQKEVVLNYFISVQFSYSYLIWMFSSVRSYKKLILRFLRGFYDYVKMILPRDMTNICANKT